MNSLRIIDSEKITEETISSYIPRSMTQFDEIKSEIIDIINQVKLNGDESIIKLSKKFDKVELLKSDIKVKDEEIKEAYEKIETTLLEAIRTAKQNLIQFHEAQLREEWSIEIRKGVKAGQVYRPLESIGIYIPGGRAIYPSTVLMAITPALVAGVKKMIICSPPQKDKKIAPEILVAANEYGLKDIYKVGGAQAISAMAYGTETIPKVQKIVGPGNKWVNGSKQLLRDIVAIDNPAGPSEILILADDSAPINYIILDFLSQIEHDPDNIGIIITPSNDLIDGIKKNIGIFIEESERKEIIKEAIKKNSLIIKALDIDECIRVSNIIAPEHLQIMTKNPKELLNRINNAGAIFLGSYSPVPLGDYSAGTNHILPTGGNAKIYSGLNVFEFFKIIDVLECNKEGLQSIADSAMTIAEFEGLLGHKKSIEERLKDKN
ncbi:MAG: histidinol dehydrogenase [Promethearchaeota archaeon]